MSDRGAKLAVRARLMEVAGQVALDEELARRLHELAKTAARTGSREDHAALFAEFARTPAEMALLLPASDLVTEEEGTTTTTTITTTTTVTTGACTTTTITTTTTTTAVVEPEIDGPVS